MKKDIFAKVFVLSIAFYLSQSTYLKKSRDKKINDSCQVQVFGSQCSTGLVCDGMKNVCKVSNGNPCENTEDCETYNKCYSFGTKIKKCLTSYD
jgi:hypothetical protein